MKKLVIGIFVVVVLATGLIVGLFFVQRSAIFKEKASSGTGTATVSISPATGTFAINTPNTVSVYFNTNNTLISGVAVELSFSSLSVHASNITFNPVLTNSTNQFTCLIHSITTDPNQPSTTLVAMSCLIEAPISQAPGFTSNTDTLLGTFDLTANAIPLENPLNVSFDAGPTKIISRADSSDIALTPSSTGSYTFTDTNVSPSPTNPGGTTTPTPTATSADVPTVTPTPTATSTTISYTTVTPAPTSTTFGATSSPTAVPIPVTGFDTPTIIALVAGGVLLLLGSLALIL